MPQRQAVVVLRVRVCVVKRAMAAAVIRECFVLCVCVCGFIGNLIGKLNFVLKSRIGEFLSDRWITIK